MIFTDRAEAGRKLASNLLKYQNEDLIILALPRGGVPVGFEIAKFLGAPLDVLIVRKLGAPSNPEFGIGAIAPNGIRIIDKSITSYLGLSEEEIKSVEDKERIELKRRIKKYRGVDSIPNVNNKTVILVDDGMATGITARAAIKAILKRNPNKLVVAIPVCSQDAVNGIKSSIRPGIDKVVCLSTPLDFASVGDWYQKFNQVSDQEVVQILSKSRGSMYESA